MAASKNWCILKNNAKLRSAIKLRLQERNVSVNSVAKTLGMSQPKMSLYLNNKLGSLTQEQIVRLANYLGIKIELNVEFI